MIGKFLKNKEFNRKSLYMYAFINLLLTLLLFAEAVFLKIQNNWIYAILAVLIILLLCCTYLLLDFIFKIPKTSSGTNQIILGTGLLIGTILITYANIYQQIYRLFGMRAFSGKTLSSNDFLYYSITTFTTTGYGDITSIGIISNAVSASEMLFGFAVNTTLMAVLAARLFQQLGD